MMKDEGTMNENGETKEERRNLRNEREREKWKGDRKKHRKVK